MLTDKKFNEAKINEISAYADAISNPYRILIIKKIAERNECITGDLELELPIKRTTVVQHLQELKKVGILRGNVKGKRVYYCLDYDKLKYIRQELQDILTIPEPGFVCCESEIINEVSILP